MHSNRPIVAFLTTAALLSSTAFTAQPAAAAPIDGWTVTGTVVAGAGSKVVVEPSIWPLSSQDKGKGNRVAMLDLQPVVTDTGSYQITIPRSAVPRARYVARDGSISVRLVISDGVSAEIQEMTADPTTVVTASRAQKVDFKSPNLAPQVKPDDPAPRVILKASKLLPGLTRQKLAAAPTNPRASVTAASATDATPDVVPMGGCYTFEGAEHGPYKEVFARVYGTANVKGSVDQLDSSSHTIGVAVKAAGGSWGASGTARVEVTASAGYMTDYNIVDSSVANNVKQKYYTTECNTSGEWEVVSTISKPIRITSGPYFAQVAHTNYSNCTAAYSGVTYKRTSNKNGTISGGMDLPFINTTAQAGWTTATTIAYKFTKAGSICGSNDEWMQAASISTKA